MCCQGQPMEMTSQISPFAQQLGQQTAGTIGQGIGQGATQMPPELFQAYAQSMQPNPFTPFAANMLGSQFFGSGWSPYQPPQIGNISPYGMGQQMPFMGFGGGFGGGIKDPYSPY